MMVADALDFYAENRSDISAPERSLAAINRLKAYLGKMNITNIDIESCNKYFAKRKKDTVMRYGEAHPISDSTIARELGVLRAASNLLVKWKKIPYHEQPTFDIPTNLPKREIWLHRDEVIKLFDASENDETLNAFIQLLYVTASRREAIEQLEWSQIDFSKKTISLKKPGERETTKRRPTVPMGTLCPLLTSLYEKRKNRWVLGKNMNRYRQFVRLADSVGLLNVPERDGRPAGRVVPHVMRHSRATHLLESGMSIYRVAQLLGDNPLTVQRVYAHACLSDLQRELEKFG